MTLSPAYSNRVPNGMAASLRTGSSRNPVSAFSLLELVVTMTIMAILASAGMFAYENMDERARLEMSRTEMQRMRQAILQFKADTGYLPGNGPFAMTSEGGADPVPIGSTNWAASPANFRQLFTRPLMNGAVPVHPLAQFNVDTGRGWNGPYLTSSSEGVVDVGNNLSRTGVGNPTAGSVLSAVPGVADPFEAKPVGSTYVWRSVTNGEPRARWGRPYFLFDMTGPNNLEARIVSCGPNRTFENGGGDDLTVYISK